jgi:predicted lysophospholipase L1 biosynthesis ABC-type transport system permease subunit
VAPEDVAKEAGAGLAGGLAAALLASLPFAVLDGESALIATLMALAFLPALMTLAIARLRGRSWLVSVVASAIGLGVALLVVLIKYELGH